MSEPRLPTDAELEDFRRLIEETLADVETGLAHASEDAKPVGLDLAIGRVSRVDAMQQQQIAVARRGELERRQRQLRAALGRIDAGTFGECLHCEEPIGLGRLRARPESPLCRECQQRGGR